MKALLIILLVIFYPICIPLAMAEDYVVTDDYSSETGEEDATSDTLYFEILDIKYDYTMEYKNGAWDANG